MERLDFDVNKPMQRDMDDMCERAGFPKGKEGYRQLILNSLALFIKGLDVSEAGGEICAKDPNGRVRVADFRPFIVAAANGEFQRRIAQNPNNQ